MSSENIGWVAVDLDGTLAHYDGWKGPEHIGLPVPAMLSRVKTWLTEGKDVRIFTARVFPLIGFEASFPLFKREETEAHQDAYLAGIAVKAWCEHHLGRALPITCRKDFRMVELWDDRAVSVLPNAGVPANTIVAHHLHRLLTGLGVPVVDGQNYGTAVDAALHKVVPTLRGVRMLKDYLEGITDALSYEVKNNNPSADVRRAFTTVCKAQNLIDV